MRHTAGSRVLVLLLIILHSFGHYEKYFMFLRVLLSIFGRDEGDWKAPSPEDRAVSYRISTWRPTRCKYVNRVINVAGYDQFYILYTHNIKTLPF